VGAGFLRLDIAKPARHAMEKRGRKPRNKAFFGKIH
jgi:hypothetical protein